jgi:hypothetical protein
MRRLVLLLPALALAACDLLGIESSEAVAARRDAEGRAVGAACRHADRAIEDCYVLNKKVDKAAIFAGWRDMNDYMRDNQIEPLRPQYSGPADAAPKPTAATEDAKKSDDAKKSASSDDAKKPAAAEPKPRKTDA